MATIMVATLLIAVLASAAYREYWRRRTGVQTSPTFRAARNEILAALQVDRARLGDGAPYTIVDMGAGSGQLCRSLASALPDAQVTGIEISPVPWLCSVLARAVFGPRNLRFIRQDFWSFDLSSADAVVMLLEPVLAERLGQKLHSELKHGSIAISNEVKLGDGWEPIETRQVRLFGIGPANIYIYCHA